MAYSLDGKNWVGMGTTTFATEGRGIYYSVNQSLWIATGTTVNNMAKSVDGFTWTPITSPFDVICNDVVYANTVGRWVAVGGNVHTIAVSTDATTWTGLGLTFFSLLGDKGTSVEFSPSLSQFIVTGTTAGNTQGYSSDGLTWTGTPPLFSNSIAGVAFGQNKWIVTGPATPLPTPFANSTTGTNWIIGSQLSIVNGCRGITYNLEYDMWVAACYGTSQIIYSFDGNSWLSGASLFSVTGYRVATTGKRLVPFTIVDDVVGTVMYNTSQILSNATISVLGSLTIDGDLYVFGGLNASVSGSVDVSGGLGFSGSLLFQVGVGTGNTSSSNSSGTNSTSAPVSFQTCNITSDTLSITTANLTLSFDKPLIAGTYSVVVMNYRSASSGQFQLQPVIGLDPTKCTTTSQSYSSSSLSVLFTVSDGGCSNTIVDVVSGTPTTMTIPTDRTAMIIGVSVGCVCGAVLFTLAIVLIMVQRQNRLDKQANEFLKKDEIDNLKHISQARAGSNIQ